LASTDGPVLLLNAHLSDEHNSRIEFPKGVIREKLQATLTSGKNEVEIELTGLFACPSCRYTSARSFALSATERGENL